MKTSARWGNIDNVMNEIVRTRPHRLPKDVMRLKRLGSLHQCRLSFMRVLTRRMADESWTFTRPVFEIDYNGVGHAVYSAKGPKHTYSLVAFAHDLPPDQRSDRVIAEAWDATFTLFDGVPTKTDIERLSQNVPKQEAGRVTDRELSLSRANRSVRLWDYVVGCLANGLQPDPSEIDAVGYLMRTTAVYGSGKFGAADRETIAKRTELQAPFQAEMLSVYLIRTFARDLVEEMARHKGGENAVSLDLDLAERLGIGNSTGLGMAPFIINHAMLFNNWILAREEAISRVRSVVQANDEEIAVFLSVLQSSMVSISHWHTEHPLQLERLENLRADLAALLSHLETTDLSTDYAWDQLINWATLAMTEEGQELLNSLLLEPYPALVDGLGSSMATDEQKTFVIDGMMSVGQACDLIEDTFGWALNLDFSEPTNCARVWYVSQEKLEPRLGERFEEPVSAYEQPLAPARDAVSAYQSLKMYGSDETIAGFLLRHPEHRHTIRRVQLSRLAPYSEIRDNTISSDLLPIDMLRAKLAFFGATHFDPRSDRWVRICMFGGAPYPEELGPDNADHWVYPEHTS